MANWKFYGRTEQLSDLERMLSRQRWFFAQVTGRRRIGKTALIQQAMREVGIKRSVFYVQIPDSESAGVLSE
ncbi:ATP-binding protein [Schlesneria sp. DSM 10557]|uniref:ATP-binding protein n=1 Tax=Schlesneria sp. DSM 10557 TaxID=3044399 RepID=UPI0035A0BF7B